MPAKSKPKSTVQPKATEYSEAVVPQNGNSKGMIRISRDAIACIVRRAACSVDGVTRLTGSSLVDNIAEFVGSRKVLDRAMQIQIGEQDISIDLSINIRYGVSLPETAAAVQRAVAGQLEEMTGLKVAQVNVVIREMEDVSDEEEEDSEE
ncbi:MAG: Asp23/Gls24 family envelope stress response protein [Lentisphaeria bacterium]|nr:Asp23/Gls24 family envelope stress response protein [Lentisphaeria bacterium]